MTNHREKCTNDGSGGRVLSITSRKLPGLGVEAYGASPPSDFPHYKGGADPMEQAVASLRRNGLSDDTLKMYFT